MFKRMKSLKSRKIMNQALRLRREQYCLASFYKNLKFLYPILGAIYIFFSTDFESINNNIFMYWEQDVFAYWGRIFMVLLTSLWFLVSLYLERNYYIRRYSYIKSKNR